MNGSKFEEFERGFPLNMATAFTKDNNIAILFGFFFVVAVATLVKLQKRIVLRKWQEKKTTTRIIR